MHVLYEAKAFYQKHNGKMGSWCMTDTLLILKTLCSQHVTEETRSEMYTLMPVGQAHILITAYFLVFSLAV